MDTCVFMCVWSLAVSFGCHSSGFITLFFETKSLTGLDLTEQARLAVCPRDPPVPTSPALRIHITTEFGSSMWALGIKSSPHA